MLYARTVALVGVIALITTALLIPADYSRSEMVRVVSDDISDWAVPLDAWWRFKLCIAKRFS